MSIYFLWGGIGLFVFFLLIGFLSGLTRGLKRASLHLVFFALSIVVAFLITKPVTNSVLDCTVTINGVDSQLREVIVEMLKSNFDLTNFASMTTFMQELPAAVVSPILFILLTIGCFFVFDILYLIISRICLGSKKKDFSQHKPFRLFGSMIGIVEGFLFLFVLFAPLTALTKTYQEISYVQETATTSLIYDISENQTSQTPEEQLPAEEQPAQSTKLETIPEMLKNFVPPIVDQIITEYNNCLIGKVAGAGGVDKMLFDGLSSFKFQGENINLRKEILNLTDTYDDFVVVYNNLQDKNFDAIDLTALKTDIETFLNNGIFKTVLSDTVKDYITKTDLETAELSQILKDVLKDIKVTFSKEEVKIHEYLKHDILSIVDIADNLFKSKMIKDIVNLNEITPLSIMEVIDEHNEETTAIAQNFFEMNLVEDSFQTLISFASTKFEEAMQNDKDLVFALNTNVTDKTKMVEDILKAVKEFLSLNGMLNISDLMAGNDIMETLNKIDDIDSTFDQAGKAFDTLKQLELLVLPQEDGSKIYVFDNILKLYELELLKDTVYMTVDATETVKLDTYTKFFEFLKTPIKNAKVLGLLDMNKESFDFDKVLDKLLELNKQDQQLLAKTLLPFKQLTVLNLQDVFTGFTDALATNVTILDFTQVQDDFADWKTQLNFMGQTLNALNQGNIENKTFIKYLLTADSDMNTLLKAIIDENETAEKNVFKEILDPVFSAKIFTKLTRQIFDSADAAIAEYTGVNPETKIDKIAQTKDQVISDLENLLKITLNKTGDFTLEQVGQILDILKTNAYNNGAAEKGLFNDIFANLIWFMTGEAIDGKIYTAPAHQHHAIIKTGFEEILSIHTAEDYYTCESYAAAMAEIAIRLPA